MKKLIVTVFQMEDICKGINNMSLCSSFEKLYVIIDNDLQLILSSVAGTLNNDSFRINSMKNDDDLRTAFFSVFNCDESLFYKHITSRLHSMLIIVDYYLLMPLIDDYIEYAFNISL